MSLWRELEEAAERGETVALCTVIGVEGSSPREAGARMLVWPDGRSRGTIGGGVFEYRVIDAAVAALREGRPRRYAVHLTRDLGMCCGGAMEVYIEPQVPEEHLVVFGAGHVAKAVVPLAVGLGFRVTVIDERDDYATAERFPAAAVRAEDARRFARTLATDNRTWLLAVTHEHALDQDLLELLLPRPFAWFGMIGSRTKLTRFFLRLQAGGMDPALFTRVCAPVGLDLGAQTPEEIAIAIAAELVRVRHRVERPPVPLSAIPIPARGGDGTARAPRMGGNGGEAP